MTLTKLKLVMLCLNVIILNWLLNLNNGHFINSNAPINVKPARGGEGGRA